jgi:hypothetical protein
MSEEMPRIARLLLLCVVVGAALGGLAVPRALAAPTPPSCADLKNGNLVESAHVALYYWDDDETGAPAYLSETQAGMLLATLERAYQSFQAAGFPAPDVDPVNHKVTFQVMDLTPWKWSAIPCAGDGGGYLDKASVTGAYGDYHLASNVFTQVAYGLAITDAWLVYGVSAWAAWHALGYPPLSVETIGPFDMSLNCASLNAPHFNCSPDGFANDGETRWPFYEYLAEKYGTHLMIDIFTAASSAPDGLTALQNALAAKGTTLGAEYSSFAGKLLYGGWSATPLNAAVIPVSGSPIQTGASSGAIPSQSVGVNHLATRFLEIDRGDGDGSHACYEAALTLTVTMPAGVTSQPTFLWVGGGSTPVSLSISGQTATTTVPWDTCKWGSKAYLSLPNTSVVDGESFVVSGTLAVDFSKPASAATPPPPSPVYGTVVNAGSTSAVPTLSLFGPSTLKVKDDATQLKLALQASGEGSVRVSIGSASVGTFRLVTGGNNLKVTLPKQYSGKLTLTPVAPDGTTTGAALSRALEVQASEASLKVANKNLAFKTKTTSKKKHVTTKKKSSKKHARKSK